MRTTFGGSRVCCGGCKSQTSLVQTMAQPPTSRHLEPGGCLPVLSPDFLICKMGLYQPPSHKVFGVRIQRHHHAYEALRTGLAHGECSANVDCAQSCQQGLVGAEGALQATPVDVTQLVQRVDGQHHLGQVELGQLGREAVFKAAQESEEVPTSVVVHHQVLDGGGWG